MSEENGIPLTWSVFFRSAVAVARNGSGCGQGLQWAAASERGGDFARLHRIRARGSKRVSRLLLLWLAAAVVGSCRGAEEQASDPDLAASGNGGYTLVRSSDLPWLELEREKAIEGFHVPISWVLVASDGTLAVSLLNSVIRLFDAEGREVGSIGGPAGGFGDVSLNSGAGWVGDTLWSLDPTLGRIALHSSAGSPLGTLRPLVGARPPASAVDTLPAFLSLLPLSLYPGGDLLAIGESPVAAGPGAVYRDGTYFLRVSPDGEILHVVLWLPDRADLLRGRRGTRLPTVAAPGSPGLWDVAPDGSRLGALTSGGGLPRGAWRLLVVDGRGEEVFRRVFRLAEAARDDSGPARANRGERTPGAQVGKGEAAEDSALAHSISGSPGALLFGSDLRLWVGFGQTPPRREWLILDREGDPARLMLLPSGARLLAADDRHLWVAEEADGGGTTLVRYRITGSG